MSLRKGDIVGLALVFSFGVGCVFNYLFGVPDFSILKSKRDLVKITRNIKNNIADDVFVEANKIKTYNKVIFNNIDDFVNSLQSVVNISGADKFIQNNLFDCGSGILFKIYENNSKTIQVIVDDAGRVKSCKFINIIKDEEKRLKELSYILGYSVKYVTDGIIMEENC